MRDLEAARFAADRAFRQYDAADPPDATGGAAELEVRWNRALTRVGEVEARIASRTTLRQRVHPCRRSRIDDGLAGDLEAVWNAPYSDARLKKRIARTLIQEVIADIDHDASEIVLLIHWAGGVQQPICGCRGAAKGQRNSTSADIITAVRELVTYRQ